MKLFNVSRLAALFGLLLIAMVSAQAQKVTFSNRVNTSALEPSDSEPLRIGFLADERTPFGMLRPGRAYEGILVDMTDLVFEAGTLNYTINIYSDFQAAQEALLGNQIDLISTHGWPLKLSEGLEQSDRFIRSRVAMFRRINDSRDYVAGDKTLVGGVSRKLYQDKSWLSGEDANGFRVYDSDEEVLAALSFEEIDYAVGELIRFNDLINKNYFNYVKIDRLLPGESYGAFFILRKNEREILDEINYLISKVDPLPVENIIQKWSGGLSFRRVLDIKLSQAEKEWISKNSSVRFLVSGDQAPVAFMDEDENFSGSAADILKLFSLKTGVRVEASSVNKIESLVQRVSEKKATMAVLSASEERERNLLFTQEFLNKPFAIVADSERMQSCDFSRDVLALPEGHIVLFYLKAKGVRASIRYVHTFNEALDLVLSGVADCAVAPINIAQYYLNRQSDKDLRIVGIWEGVPASFAFAISKKDPELHSILEKIIAVIPSGELDMLATRWRLNSAERAKTWYDYRVIILEIVAASMVLLLLVLAWVYFLRKQIIHRKLAENELGEQLVFIRKMLDSIPHPVYFCSPQGELAGFNSSFVNFLAPNVLDGDEWRAGDFPVVNTYFHRIVGLDHSITRVDGFEGDREIEYNGRYCSVYHWVRPYSSKDGSFKGLVCGWIDITEKQELIRQMAQAREEAMRASKAKSTFLATMSHEIRTPMNAIIGMLELVMARYEQGEFYIDGVKVASSSANDLLGLIGDILDISRIESGKVEINKQASDLAKVVSAVVNVFSGLAKQKGLLLALELGEGFHKPYFFDPARVRQIVSNLIGNAIKFTDRGGVSVHLNMVFSEQKGRCAHIEVRDTGVGISDVDLEKIFEPFVQGGEALQRGGTGLGLKISKMLCEMMGGGLEITDNPGGGAIATMVLPLEEEPASVEPLLSEVQERLEQDYDLGESKHILLVDDHPANRLLLSQQLKFLGHKVLEASDGAAALELCSAHNFDMVITDCQMPIMDGYRLTEQIRKLERSRKEERVPIIGYTANAQKEEQERCIKAGMDGCLFKPITLRELSDAIGGYRITTKSTSSVLVSYDLGEIRRIAAGDRDLIGNLVSELIKSNVSDILALREAMLAGDMMMVSEVVHKIKGGMKLVSAAKIVAKCEKIESLSKLAMEGELNNSVDKLIVMLDEFHQEISSELDV